MTSEDIKNLQVDTSVGSKIQSGIVVYNIILISILSGGVSLFVLNLNESENNTFVIIGNLLIYLPSYFFILTLYLNNKKLTKKNYTYLFIIFAAVIFGMVVSFQKREVGVVKNVTDDDGNVVKKVVKSKEILIINIILTVIFFSLLFILSLLLFISKYYST